MRHPLIIVRLCIPCALLFLLISSGCKKNQSSAGNSTSDSSQYATGWTGTDDPSTVPQALNLTAVTGSSITLPSQVDLSPYCPPVGNQDPTSTCVGWSTGYYAKTISEAIANNYGQAQIASPQYELSPKSMFLEIPDPEKGVYCRSGTEIIDALSVLVDTGVATMATVPWSSDIIDCSQTVLEPAWLTEAANHKINYYRVIPATIQAIKEQLAANFPVLMGIKVSNELYNYSSGVITTATFPNPPDGHAQCIVGYDDNQGPAGAFHVVNSWGSSWGQNGGYYWIDYNTLVNLYISSGNVYIMSSPVNSSVDTVTNSSVVDIMPWVYSDISTSASTGVQASRRMYFNILNIGGAPADASTTWNVYYAYCNAFNANDYGVIYHDQFNNSIAANTYTCPSADACELNYNIPGGSGLAQVAFGDTVTYQDYVVPSITGLYYLALIADADNALGEVNMQNNIFFTTGQLPAAFVDGTVDAYNPQAGAIHDGNKNPLALSEQNLRFSKYNSAVGNLNRNAYTPQEILSFFKAKYKSGELQRKANSVPDNIRLSHQLH